MWFRASSSPRFLVVGTLLVSLAVWGGAAASVAFAVAPDGTRVDGHGDDGAAGGREPTRSDGESRGKRCDRPRAPISCNGHECLAASEDGLALLTSRDGTPTSLGLCNASGTTTLAFGPGAGFTLTDVDSEQSYALDFPRTVVRANRLQQSGAAAAGLTVSATTEALPDRLRIVAVVRKTGTTDRLVRLCYNLPFDAAGWRWHDSIRKSRRIQDAIDYTSVVGDLYLVPTDKFHYDAEHLPPLQQVAFATVTNATHGLGVGVPQDKPRSFFVHYDNTARQLGICFDFALSDKTVNFANRVDVEFVLYALDEPSYGYRAALAKYWQLFAGQFVATPAVHGAHFDSYALNPLSRPPEDKYHPAPLGLRFCWSCTALDADQQLGGLYQWMDAHYYGYDLSYFRTDVPCAPLDADYQALMQRYYEGLLHYLQGTAPALTPQLDCTHEPRTNNESCRPPQTPSYVGCWRFLRPGPGYEWDNYEIYAGKLQRVDPVGYAIEEVLCSGLLDGAQVLSPGVAGLEGTTSYIDCGLSSCRVTDLTHDQTTITYLNPSPTLPAPASPLCTGMPNWGTVNITHAVEYAVHPDAARRSECTSIDTFGTYGAADYNPAHFTNVSVPLVYDRVRKVPVVYTTFALYEYTRALRAALEAQLGAGACITANGPGYPSGGFLANYLSAGMGEISGLDINAGFVGLEATDPARVDNLLDYYYRFRVLMKDKPFTPFVTDYTRSKVFDSMELLAFYGFFSFFGYGGVGTGNPSGFLFWDTLSAADYDRFAGIHAVVRRISEAGWQPLTFAYSSDPAVLVERFGSAATGALYLSLRNTAATTRDVTVRLDRGRLGLHGPVTLELLLGPEGVSAQGATIMATLLPSRTIIVGLHGHHADADGDGVADAQDVCPGTPPGAVVDPATGCSIAELCPCEGPRGTHLSWKNHGQYVSCVARSAATFLGLGLIDQHAKEHLVAAAAASICGSR